MEPDGWIDNDTDWAGLARPAQDTIACPNCDILQCVEIEYENQQGYAYLPTTPCGVCGRDLCPFCPQHRCECGKIVCFDCSLTVPDGTASGLRLCKPCAQAADPLCPVCGEFASMRPCQDFHQQWYECTACGAAMEEDEIEAAQRAPIPRRQPGFATEHARDGVSPGVA